jgi:serine/threonine-protein kinase
MSPEQAMGRTDVDHRSDLWSFGVILFQVLTGMKPFPGGNLFEALVRICSDPVPRPSSIAPDLPPGTDAFFERALERDVGKRFQSARELERAFYALVARPSTSLPPDPITHPRDAAAAEVNSSEVHGFTIHPRGKNPRLVGAAVAGLVLLAAAVVAWRSRATPSVASTAAAPATAASAGAASPAVPASAPRESLPAAPSAPAIATDTTSPVSALAVPASEPAAHAAVAPRVGAAFPAAHPAPAQPAHKPKRDLGY